MPGYRPICPGVGSESVATVPIKSEAMQWAQIGHFWRDAAVSSSPFSARLVVLLVLGQIASGLVLVLVSNRSHNACR